MQHAVVNVVWRYETALDRLQSSGISAQYSRHQGNGVQTGSKRTSKMKGSGDDETVLDGWPTSPGLKPSWMFTGQIGAPPPHTPRKDTELGLHFIGKSRAHRHGRTQPSSRDQRQPFETGG